MNPKTTPYFFTASVELAALLFGPGEDLAQRTPEPQRPVTGREHRGAHPAAAAVTQHGRRARTSSYRPMTAVENDGELLVLREVGTGGTDRQWDGQFWVHPLPPDGPVTFSASWLLYGAGEQRVELDSSAIQKAAERGDLVVR
jgi:hypothetical protein